MCEFEFWYNVYMQIGNVSNRFILIHWLAEDSL